MSEQYFIRASGQVRGPFHWNQLLDLRDRGRLQAFHELSSDRATWVEASTLTELFPPAAPPARNHPAASAPPESTEAWFFAGPGGQRQGPVSRAQLAGFVQGGTVPESSLVWTKGMAEWQPALQALPELFGGPPGAPFAFSTGAGTSGTGDWKSARIGLTLALVGAFVFAGSIVMFFLAILIAALNAGAGDVNLLGLFVTMGVMILVTELVMSGSVVVETIGFGFCIGTPPQSGARGLAITTFILSLATTLAVFTYFISILSGGFGDVDGLGAAVARRGFLMIVLLFSFFLFFGYRFVFLLYLRAVAVACRATSLAQNLIYLTILYGVLVLFALVYFLVMFLGDQAGRVEGGMVILVLSFVLLILGLGWLAWYLVLLFQCRRVVGQR